MFGSKKLAKVNVQLVPGGRQRGDMVFIGDIFRKVAFGCKGEETIGKTNIAKH